jgi:hypothetical protein
MQAVPHYDEDTNIVLNTSQNVTNQITDFIINTTIIILKIANISLLLILCVLGISITISFLNTNSYLIIHVILRKISKMISTL